MELAVDHRTPLLSAAPSRSDVARRTRSGQSEALQQVLAELGERVKPITLARERTLPVAAPFDRLLPDEGLVRGRVLSCRGVADTSLAFGLIRDALAQGAWGALVDVSTFGADAASEFGIPLERIVRVETGAAEAESTAGVGAVASWIDVMGAAVDGFDVVVTTVPAEVRSARSPAAVRKLATRVQQKGAIVVVLGESGALTSDLVFSTERTEWSGVTEGAGHLRSRIIHVVAGGRRLPVSRNVSLLVDATSGRAVCSLAPAPTIGSVSGTRATVDIVDMAEESSERDPQAELLAEMADSLAATTDPDAGLRGLDSDASDRRLAG
ncbi:MAG: hypothetical protein ABJH68_14115 [Ilumatobacter sp.]|uniref:hypothetical protein n=1 Tax=Ilumatobacter sp. TaxID=1967498 RepID=UPI003298187E